MLGLLLPWWQRCRRRRLGWLQQQQQHLLILCALCCAHALRDAERGTAGFSRNPALLADGTFNHRQVQPQEYGFRSWPDRISIPGHAGEQHEQLSWLRVAECCAATPRMSPDPARDVPHADAFAPPPASRCLTLADLLAAPPRNYLDDVEPRGQRKSPCREANVGCVLPARRGRARAGCPLS